MPTDDLSGRRDLLGDLVHRVVVLADKLVRIRNIAALLRRSIPVLRLLLLYLIITNLVISLAVVLRELLGTLLLIAHIPDLRIVVGDNGRLCLRIGRVGQPRCRVILIGVVLSVLLRDETGVSKALFLNIWL